MFKNIKPTLVITLICLISSALLILTYNATYVDNSGVITDEMVTALTENYGSAEGFSICKDENVVEIATQNGANFFLCNEKGEYAVNVVADGYAKNGLDVLVCFNKNYEVIGVDILKIAETPNLGTRVNSEDFLSQYDGLTYEKLPSEEVIKEEKLPYRFGTKTEIDELKNHLGDEHSAGFEYDIISGATYSSNGMNHAVSTAINAINALYGED